MFGKLAPMCERFSTGSEPLNTASAGLILLMGLYALFVWFRSWHRDRFQLVLTLLAIAVGAGMLVFHTVATLAVVQLDSLPLKLFLLASFILILRRMYRLSLLRTTLVIALIVLTSLLFALLVPPGEIGEGSRYLTLLAALYLMAGGLIIKARLGMHGDRGLTGMAAARSDALHFPRLRAGYGLIVVGIIFALALAVKALDMPLCNRFASGSHFVFHLLVAVMLWRMLSIAFHYPTAPEVQARLAEK